MKKTCERFTKPNAFAHLITLPLESELRAIATAFTDLQQQRLAADYDVSQVFRRIFVLTLIDQAESAMTSWHKVRNTPNANVFLTALLLGNRWNK